MKKFLSILLAVLMAVSLTACGSKSSAPAASAAPADTTATPTKEATAEPAKKEILVFGTSADYAPWEFMYPNEKGEMVYGGIDVSVAQYIADYLGMELKIENMDFGYLLTALNKGDFDMVLADIEPTPERLKAVDMSDPYHQEFPEKILIKAANKDKFKDVATDFNGCDVGAQTGSTKVDKVNDNFTGANVVSLPLVTDLVNELVNDKLDAVLLDHSVAVKYAETNKDLAIADASEFFGNEPLNVSVAVAKNDPKGLLPKINEAIAKLVSENKIEQFMADADKLSDVAQEVTGATPEGYTPDNP